MRIIWGKVAFINADRSYESNSPCYTTADSLWLSLTYQSGYDMKKLLTFFVFAKRA